MRIARKHLTKSIQGRITYNSPHLQPKLRRRLMRCSSQTSEVSQLRPHSRILSFNPFNPIKSNNSKKDVLCRAECPVTGKAPAAHRSDQLLQPQELSRLRCALVRPHTTDSVPGETVSLTLVSLTCPLSPAAITARRLRSLKVMVQLSASFLFS